MRKRLRIGTVDMALAAAVAAADARPSGEQAPAPAAAPATRQKTRWTNDEVLAKLTDASSDQRVPGRTLLKGHTWDGRDIPGRGSAAQRRLRQMQQGQHRQAER